MSDCFIFIQGTSSGQAPNTINLRGVAQESILNLPEDWSCIVNYGDNATTIQAKIKVCVVELYLTTRNIVIGGSDKVTFVGGIS